MGEAALAAVIQLCSWTGNKPAPCNKPAVHNVRWEWGEQLFVCEECATLVHQTAENISRRVSVSPIGGNTAAPLTRPERVKLISEKLAAEAEVEDVKTRAAELYTDNVKLTRQVQTYSVRERELGAQLRDARAQQVKLETALAEREAELGELVDELRRMQTLAKFTPRDEEPPVGPSRVDGPELPPGGAFGVPPGGAPPEAPETKGKGKGGGKG